MKVDRISYSQSRESVNSIGLKRWDKATMEGQIEDGDIYEDCYKELRHEVESELKRANPGATISVNHEYLIQPSVINKEKERIEIAIDNCHVLHELKELESDAIKYGLVKEYLEKKRKL